MAVTSTSGHSRPAVPIAAPAAMAMGPFFTVATPSSTPRPADFSTPNESMAASLFGSRAPG
jgi:hypothetical protein